MKPSSIHFKQTSNLTQYSSGEDDSGTEDLFTKSNFLLSDFSPRPIDIQPKKSLTISNVRYNRLRTGMIDTSVLTVSPSRIAKNSVPKTSTRLVSAFLPTSVKLKPHSNKNNPIVRARLWSEQRLESGYGVSEGDHQERGKHRTELGFNSYQGSHVVFGHSEQVSNSRGNSKGNQTKHPHRGSLKKIDSCRRVLSDITKETVTDYRFQLSSYYSRDVLPLDPEVNGVLGSQVKKNENPYFKHKSNKCMDSLTNGVPTRTRRTFSNFDVSKEFKTTEEKGWFSLHYQKVSMILVVIVLLFFFVLGLIYLSVRFRDAHKLNSIKPAVGYPICGSADYHQAECIEEYENNTVVSTLKLIMPQLLAKARDSLCNMSGENGIVYMSDNDALSFIQSTNNMLGKDAKQLLRSVKILVLSNPHLDVTVIQNHTDNINSYAGSNTIEENLVQHGILVLKTPLVPFSCQLELWFKSFLSWLLSSTAVSGVLFGLWNYKRRSEEHRQEVYTIVNKIINSVRNHHKRFQTRESEGESFITVEKCQKEILNTQDSKISAWEEAERYIDAHESRVLSEIRIINGKPAKIWQWIYTPSNASAIHSRTNNTVRVDEPDSSHVNCLSAKSVHSGTSWSTQNRRNKVWQGQAFETVAGSPNSLPCSPTPCLKIRHMFDPDLEYGDEWPILIQDSILEKCENVCILHMFVDCSSPEGCVFMKCSSAEEAGKAYRALHGWWFDTKLVTVKYLRTERYHERFPEAINASSLLRPSNNQRLSLQELWHFPIEST